MSSGSRPSFSRACAGVLSAVCMMLAQLPAHAERFSFMALGDTPYTLPRDDSAFQRLIARTNRLQPAFTVHLGDIKSGDTRCSDEVFTRSLELFAQFAQPLVYTPGDNEWTDCHRTNNGAYDPLERLATLRRRMYPAPERSLGATTMPLQTQAAGGEYSTYVENTRWEKAGVVFATLHIVGSNNNLQRDRAAVNEYIERNAANLAWIDAAYRRATEINARGIVFFFQADLAYEKDNDVDARSGFNDTLERFRRHSMAFGRPVLLVGGDRHRLVIDQPLFGPGRRRIVNVTRIMVHGDADVHGTLVHVDTDNPDLFSYQPVYIPENMPVWKPAAPPQ